MLNEKQHSIIKKHLEKLEYSLNEIFEILESLPMTTKDFLFQMQEVFELIDEVKKSIIVLESKVTTSDNEFLNRVMNMEKALEEYDLVRLYQLVLDLWEYVN